MSLFKKNEAQKNAREEQEKRDQDANQNAREEQVSSIKFFISNKCVVKKIILLCCMHRNSIRPAGSYPNPLF